MKTLSIIAAGLALLSAAPASALTQNDRYMVFAMGSAYSTQCQPAYDDRWIRGVVADAFAELGGVNEVNREIILLSAAPYAMRFAVSRHSDHTDTWCSQLRDILDIWEAAAGK